MKFTCVVSTVVVLAVIAPVWGQNNDNNPKVDPNWQDKSLGSGPWGPATATRQGATVIVNQPNPKTSDSLAEEKIGGRLVNNCEGMSIEVFDGSTPAGGDIFQQGIARDGSVATGTAAQWPTGTQQFSHRKVIIISGCKNIRIRQIKQVSGKRTIFGPDGKTALNKDEDGIDGGPTAMPAPFPAPFDQLGPDPFADFAKGGTGLQLDSPLGGSDAASVPSGAGQGAGAFHDAPGHTPDVPAAATMGGLANAAQVGPLTFQWEFSARYITFIYCDNRLIALVHWGFDEVIKITGAGATDAITKDPPYVVCRAPKNDTFEYYKGLMEQLDPSSK